MAPAAESGAQKRPDQGGESAASRVFRMLKGSSQQSGSHHTRSKLAGPCRPGGNEHEIHMLKPTDQVNGRPSDWSTGAKISWASQIMEASKHPPHWPGAIKTESPMLLVRQQG